MLDRPLGAMKGCLGTSWPTVGSSVAAEPVKAGTCAWGSCGIGGGVSPATYGPFGDDGKPVGLDDLPTTQAVRKGRPAHAMFRIRSASGAEHEIESSAFPIIASEEGSSGAMILFWPLDPNSEEEGST